jgi:hypothetical protein
MQVLNLQFLIYNLLEEQRFSMAKERQFIKVVASYVYTSGSIMTSKTARGIVVLKRGDTIVDFAKRFLAERCVTHFTLNQRSDNSWSTVPIMFLWDEPKTILTYVFTQFPLSEFGYYAKDLTKEEMLRDFKFLKGVLNG